MNLQFCMLLIWIILAVKNVNTESYEEEYNENSSSSEVTPAETASSSSINSNSGSGGGDQDTAKPLIEGDTIVNATRGKPAVLTCIVHNVKNYKITWYFNGILLTLNQIRIKDDKRYSVENLHPNEWKLIINPVDSANEGQYSCRLTNGMKKTIYLKVGVAPTFVENNGSHQILINTVERQNVTLSCEAEGNPTPTIYWYRHNTMITTGPHLVLKDVTRHSHTEYECVARNNIEPDPSRHFKINVNFKPTLHLMYYLKEQNKKLLSGNANSEELSGASTSNSVGQSINDGDLQLVCEITGNPINSITWFKDGQKLRDESSGHALNERFFAYRSSGNGGAYETLITANNSIESTTAKKRKKHISIHTSQLNSHKFISKLKIKNVDKNDNGLYKCFVNGFEGEYSKSLVIDEIKSQSSNDVEYTFSLQEKNGPKSNSNRDKVFKLSTSKNKNMDTNSHQLVESGYLVNERGRGARSNLTKTEHSYDLNNLMEGSAYRMGSTSLMTTFSCLIMLISSFIHY